MKKKHRAGFTLIELMIVVSIVGILSAIAIPAFRNYINKSRSSEATIKLTEIYRALSTYYITDQTIAGAALSGTNTNAGGSRCIGAPTGYFHDGPYPHGGRANTRYTLSWNAVARNLGIDDREPHSYSYYTIERSSANYGQCGGMPSGQYLYSIYAFGNLDGSGGGWGAGLEQHRMDIGADADGSPFNGGGIVVYNRGK